MGLQLGILLFRFPHDQNNHDSSGAYVLSVEMHMHEMPHREWRSSISFAFVSGCVLCKNQNAPTWSSISDDAITHGGIGVPGSPSPLFLKHCGIGHLKN